MTLTKDSSERESRPPSGQSNKTGSRRPSPARDVTPPLKVMETLASLRSNEASAQQKDAESTSRPKSKTPPGPQPTYQQQHYYPYPPPPPHMYSVPPYENNWGRMMPPPPPPGDRGRDSRGSESPVPGNTTGYPASGMPGYSLHHHQGHHHHHPHDPYPPPPHHYTHSPYPYGNPNGVHMPVYPVQTSYTYNPGVAAYGSHPPPYGGAGGNGIVGSNYGPNGESINMPPPSEQENNIHSIGPGAPPSSVPGNGFAAITATLTHTPIPESEIIYTEDAATKVTDRIRRRCYNCYTSDTSTWRRSNLAVGKVLCNKCGLFERTHSRPRPEQFPHKRTSLGGEGEGVQSPSSPSYPLTPVPSQSPSQPQDTPSRPPPSRKESIGPVKRNKKVKVGHDQPGSTDANTHNAPSSSSGDHGPGPISALHVPSQGVTNGPPSSNSPSNSHTTETILVARLPTRITLRLINLLTRCIRVVLLVFRCIIMGTLVVIMAIPFRLLEGLGRITQVAMSIPNPITLLTNSSSSSITLAHLHLKDKPVLPSQVSKACSMALMVVEGTAASPQLRLRTRNRRQMRPFSSTPR
ncbi:hypothetical protein F5050DRAFT_809525 [Lentinula boryana]|uniref:GATA-type domain-containing protein n=2 Tax=Lentinula TaxID=5352 RepID=A0ABQ8QUD3_9AGAR|nr:hypothetical protein F5050DRAFT_809525 [Lentinula boryana]